MTSDDIRAVVERPSKLGPGRDADEYQMERYRNVAKWMEQEGVVVHERQLGFVLPFQSWAALKAAGGEG